MENSQFDFHLDMLQKQGFVEHKGYLYLLTVSGKEYANRYDSDLGTYKKQAKISVWVCATRKIDNEPAYLIGTRQKNPFFGSQGFLAGKLDFGETIFEGAKREMKEESSLEGEPELVHIRHYINKNKLTNAIIEDKFMFLFIVRNPIGDIRDCKENKFSWVKKSDFKNVITSPFDSYEDFIKDIEIIESFNGVVTFEERVKFPDNF
jgi:8-oxo-dGTP pyrophosphatase MutT (NUDIX family)